MKLILLISLILLAKHSFGYEECSKLTSDCEFYTCIEKNKHCGKRAYPMAFGHKYCNKFEDTSDDFTVQGQLWLEEVKTCLIQKMDELNDQLTCKEFKSSAINHHVPCYVETGFCELPQKDRLKVIKTIAASLWRPSLIRAGLKVLSTCKRK